MIFLRRIINFFFKSLIIRCNANKKLPIESLNFNSCFVRNLKIISTLIICVFYANLNDFIGNMEKYLKIAYYIHSNIENYEITKMHK